MVLCAEPRPYPFALSVSVSMLNGALLAEAGNVSEAVITLESGSDRQYQVSGRAWLATSGPEQAFRGHAFETESA